MKTNELKKGQRVKLRNGWEAEIADNMRGNTRLAKVFGHYTELGSVYAHDIMKYQTPNEQLIEGTEAAYWSDVAHTKAQLKHKDLVDAMYKQEGVMQ